MEQKSSDTEDGNGMSCHDYSEKSHETARELEYNHPVSNTSTTGRMLHVAWNAPVVENGFGSAALRLPAAPWIFEVIASQSRSQPVM